MSILDEIIENKRKEVAQLKKHFKAIDVGAELSKIGLSRNFLDAISKPLSLIAEVKRASPSAGIIKQDFDPIKIALEYEKAGAHAISVLTDSKYFLGSIDYLKEISKAVSIPVLRKDFIIDELQIYESRLNGADAILLIVKILTDEELKKFSQKSDELGMAQIVEVHDKEELFRALKILPKIIGINNRDLKTFNVNLEATFHLLKKIPPDKKSVIVSESGIKDSSQLEKLYAAGVNAVLIGEELMKSPNVSKRIKKLFKW